MNHLPSSHSFAPIRITSLSAAIITFLSAQSASAQTVCGGNAGPDLIKGDIPAAMTNYSSVGDIDVFSIGYLHCNIGTQPVATFSSNPNHHVSIANIYRLKAVDGAARFEQIGMSWVFHSFFSLAGTVCCTNCQGGDGFHLNVNCSDSNTSSRVGSQNSLGPRYQVNASTGAFPFPAANPAFTGTIARRMQVHHADIDPALNFGSQFFVEAASVAADDAQASNKNNNASYRQCLFTGGSGEFNMSLTGTVVREAPAIHAWHAADASVMETNIDVPGDGRFILAAKATDLGRGHWRYEYAVENLNSDRSGRSFSVSLPPNAVVTNIGFHDIDYHDNDGVGNVTTDGTDWLPTVGRSDITWSTDPFADNPNANALRWGTLYNFRFDCNRGPMNGAVHVGTFKVFGSASAASIVPGELPPPACIADINPSPTGNGWVDVDDLLAVLNQWGQCTGCPADIHPLPSGNGFVNVDDMLLVLNSWGQCH